MNDAIIYREKNYSDKIKHMIDKLFDEFISSEIMNYDNILIKPNLMYYWDSSTGETTDPILVKHIINKINEISEKDTKIKIIESDASAMKTKYVFDVLGYSKLRSNNVDLINLSEGDFLTDEVQIDDKKVKIKINKILKEKNYLINIPKIKVHRNPPILTSALKNNFGLISTAYKFQYHDKLADYIRAINKLVKNDLVIVDGLVVLGKYPKKMGILMAAKNPIIADLISCKISGINPRNDQIISKFNKEGYRFEDIDIRDPDNVLSEVIKDFPKINPHREKLTWDILLGLLDLYARIVGDIKPPVLE